MANPTALYSTAHKDLAQIKNSGQYCRLFNKLAKNVKKSITQNLSQDRAALPKLIMEAVAKQNDIIDHSAKNSHKQQIQIDKMIEATNKVLHAHYHKQQKLSLQEATPLLNHISEKATSIHYLFTKEAHPLSHAQTTLMYTTGFKETQRKSRFEESPALEQVVHATFQNMQIYMSDSGFQFEETRYNQLVEDLTVLDLFYQTALFQEVPLPLQQLERHIQLLDKARFHAPVQYHAGLHDFGMIFRGHHRELELMHKEAKAHQKKQKQTMRKLKK